jgi:hypothetical protein
MELFSGRGRDPFLLSWPWSAKVESAEICHSRADHFDTNIYLETSGGKIYNLNLNVVHFFNTSVN